MGEFRTSPAELVVFERGRELPPASELEPRLCSDPDGRISKLHADVRKWDDTPQGEATQELDDMVQGTKDIVGSPYDAEGNLRSGVIYSAPLSTWNKPNRQSMLEGFRLYAGILPDRRLRQDTDPQGTSVYIGRRSLGPWRSGDFVLREAERSSTGRNTERFVEIRALPMDTKERNDALLRAINEFSFPEVRMIKEILSANDASDMAEQILGSLDRRHVRTGADVEEYLRNLRSKEVGPPKRRGLFRKVAAALGAAGLPKPETAG